jgi:hypothetical protein
LTDTAGNQTVASVSFIVDTQAPLAPIIVSPADDTTTAAAQFSVQGTAEANSLVQVFGATVSGARIGGAVAGQQLSGGAVRFALVVPLSPETTNLFVVTATDATGNESPAGLFIVSCSTLRRQPVVAATEELVAADAVHSYRQPHPRLVHKGAAAEEQCPVACQWVVTTRAT